MAVTLARGLGQYLTRTTGLPSGATDYSCTFWVRVDALPPSAQRAIAYRLAGAGVVHFQLQSELASVEARFIGNGGAGTGQGFLRTFTLTQWVPVSYVRYFDTVDWLEQTYIGGDLAGNLFLDFSAATFTDLFLGGDGFGAGSDQSFAYFREWTAALTLTEMRAELASATVVRTADLFTNTPLTSDLLDLSGNGHDWTFVGSGAPVFAATPTLTCTSRLAFGIGASIRSSQATVGSQAFGSDGLAGLFPFIVNAPEGTIFETVFFGSGSSTGFVFDIPPTYVLVQTVVNYMGLVYRNTTGYTRSTVANPYADPLLGAFLTPATPPHTAPPRSGFGFHRWAVICETSTFNHLTRTYTQDGMIRLTIDGMTVVSASGVDIQRRRTRFDLPQLTIEVFPCGDMDALWITNAAVVPTYSGAQDAPSSPYLQAYYDFNDGARPAGWTADNIRFPPNDGLYTASGLADSGGFSLTPELPSAGPQWNWPGSHSYGSIRTTMTLTPPVIGVGTIIVIKVTTPTIGTVFTFTMSGGIAPSVFTLADGQSQSFTEVPAGTGYALEEEAVDGYLTTYEVSNGSAPGNLSVAEGEVVTITVTNTQGTPGLPPGGIVTFGVGTPTPENEGVCLPGAGVISGIGV